MAIRRREVQPDEVLTLRGGKQIAVVSEGALYAHVARVVQFLDFAGGTVNITVLREPTDLPNEMVTIGAVVEWKDRTDARAQPEPTAARVERAAAEVEQAGQEWEDLSERIGNLEPSAPPQVSAPMQPPPQAPADEALSRVDEALNGAGAGALPFQRGDAGQPVDGEVRSGQIVGLSTSPEVPQAPVPSIEQRVAHEEGSHYTPVGPAPGQSDEDVQDGLRVDPDAVDDEAVPEHLR
jgi:hypothetical protein